MTTSYQGKRIDELVSIRKAHEINQELFNIIIRFCTKVIDSEITSIESLKEYILNEVSKYSYKMPQEQSLAGLPVDILKGQHMLQRWKDYRSAIQRKGETIYFFQV